MASQPFAEISDQEIENLTGRAIPDKMKMATKYGMKIFNGKIHVYMHLTYNILFNRNIFSPNEIYQCLKPLNCQCKHDKTFFLKLCYFTFLCKETIVNLY